MDTIGSRLSACIKALGMTKTAFAERLNLTQSYISKITSDSAEPS